MELGLNGILLQPFGIITIFPILFEYPDGCKLPMVIRPRKGATGAVRRMNVSQ